MFGNVAPTPFDLRFRMFGIPVHVTPWFWVGGVFLGWPLVNEQRYDLLLIWLGCMFISILVHEYGHAFSAEWFGYRPEIYLYQFGGLAVFEPYRGFTTTRSVIISFAGPGAGFLLYGAAWSLAEYLFPRVPGVGLMPAPVLGLNLESSFRIFFLLDRMKWINLWWGVLNLLPVIPLDGGRISEAILAHFRQWDGRRIAIQLGIVVAGAAALYFVWRKENYTAILLGLLCISNVQALQQPRSW